MKRVLLFCIVICGIFSSCSSKVEEVKTETNGNVESFVLLKSELMDLNNSMQISFIDGTKAPRYKWWHYIIVGAADAVGGLAGGGVAGAVAASALAWTIIKDSVGSTKTKSGDSEALFLYTEPISSVRSEDISLKFVSGTGKLHNSIILSLYEDYGEKLFTLPKMQLIDLIENRVSKMIGCSYEEAKLTAEQEAEIDCIVNSYFSSKTIEEFIEKMKCSSSLKIETEILGIIQVILDGYSSIDAIENDGKYECSVKEIIIRSDISEKSKQVLLDVSSVANASQRLWNISALY